MADTLNDVIIENANLHNTINSLRQRVAELEKAGMALNIGMMVMLATCHDKIEVDSATVQDVASNIIDLKIKVEDGEKPLGVIYRLERKSKKEILH